MKEEKEGGGGQEEGSWEVSRGLRMLVFGSEKTGQKFPLYRYNNSKEHWSSRTTQGEFHPKKESCRNAWEMIITSKHLPQESPDILFGI